MCHDAECCYCEYYDFCIVMLNVIMLSVVTLSAIMLIVVMLSIVILNVVAPIRVESRKVVHSGRLQPCLQILD
jgi:hypothetical protein